MTTKEAFEDYEGFVEKFKPKKTTDDCYTPPRIYETVADWACARFGIDPASIVRPFYPGGDYERFDYPDGCVVLDNPPFSILSKIVEFYLDRGIAFFLFAPGMTSLSSRKTAMRCNHIFTDIQITYANGAKVPTSFITSFGGNVAETAPDLHRAMKTVEELTAKKKKRELPKYCYPDEVLTASMLKYLSKNGEHFEVSREDCTLIAKLDAQAEAGKAIFGCGLLLSREKAAEKAAAEKAAATRWPLSARERKMIEQLGR